MNDRLGHRKKGTADGRGCSFGSLDLTLHPRDRGHPARRKIGTADGFLVSDTDQASAHKNAVDAIRRIEPLDIIHRA